MEIAKTISILGVLLCSHALADCVELKYCAFLIEKEYIILYKNVLLVHNVRITRGVI
jgi:hypothetical protein